MRMSFHIAVALLCVSAGAYAADEQIPCADEPTDMIINVGNIINCGISPIGDTDLFRFEGTAGDELILTLTDRTGGSPAPVAELFDPTNAPIDTLIMQDSGDRRHIELTMTGTYTVLVRESGDNSTVTYNLALQSLFPAPPEAQALCFDCEIADAVDVIADTDVFVLDVEEPSTIILTLTDRTGGSPAPVAEVYDSDRELVATLVEQDTGEDWIAEIPGPGTFTVLVGESADNSTVTYNIALQQLAPIPQSAACIEYGAVIEDVITPVADSDVFYFPGTEATTIMVTLTDRTGGSPAPVAEIFDPQNTLVATLVNQDGSDSWQSQLTIAGNYTVLVRESGFNSTVSYNLALQCLFPSSDACPSCLTPSRKTSWGGLKTVYR